MLLSHWRSSQLLSRVLRAVLRRVATMKMSNAWAVAAYRNPIDSHGIAATISSEITSAPI
jgi:hypothetical protein